MPRGRRTLQAQAVLHGRGERPQVLLVWFALLRCAAGRREAHPGMEWLEAATSFGERSIRGALRRLRELGLIAPSGHTSGGVRIWALHPEAMGGVAEDPAPDAASAGDEEDPAPRAEDPAPRAEDPAPPANVPTYTESDLEGSRGAGEPGLFGPMPATEEVLEELADQALAWWGYHVNKALGKRKASAKTYRGSRKHVAKAVREHGLELVLDGFRALAKLPAHEELRRKARRGRAGFLSIPWWLTRIAEHANDWRSHGDATSIRTLNGVHHQTQGDVTW